MIISLQSFLIISIILFTLGIFIVVTRKNAIAILMGIELILNAAGINFVAFNHYRFFNLDGQIFTIFIIVLAACEACVALAIVLSIFRNFRDIDAEKINALKY